MQRACAAWRAAQASAINLRRAAQMHTLRGGEVCSVPPPRSPLLVFTRAPYAAAPSAAPTPCSWWSPDALVRPRVTVAVPQARNQAATELPGCDSSSLTQSYCTRSTFTESRIDVVPSRLFKLCLRQPSTRRACEHPFCSSHWLWLLALSSVAHSH